MKIAFLANYAENTGYSIAARHHILALDSIGVTVVPRHIRMTSMQTDDYGDRIKELEQNDLSNVDVLIQHNLPSTFDYKGGVTNIGMYYYETNSIINTGWSEHLGLMDKIVVSCNEQKQALLNSDLYNKCHVCPIPTDTNRFKKIYRPLVKNICDDTVVFLTIAENNRRKNLGSIVLAYSSIFSSTDNVLLIIRCNEHKAIKQLVQEIRQGSNRFADIIQFPRILVISDYLNDHQLCELHYNADIYVNSSFGESWCIPSVDSAGFGNRIVAPKNGAFLDYKSYGLPARLIDGQKVVCYGAQGSPRGLYTSEENWFNVSTNLMAKAMLEEYKKGKTLHVYNSNIENLSYQSVGQKLLNIIEEK